MANHRHTVTEYAEKVLEEKIIAGQLVKLACQRHIDDLKKAKLRDWPFYFDEYAADHALNFYDYLKHSKGEWAGQTVKLEPWQKFIIGSVFGWLHKSTGLRRFRTVYEEVARKNGKSTKLAGIGNYGFIADGEPGAEVYTAATKRDQAKITHAEAVRMVKKSPDLRKRVKIYKDIMVIEDTDSKFEPLGADGDTMDGLNVHVAIIDELHAHKTREVYDVIETATGSRRQPLIYCITTAGFNQQGICYELRDYCIKMLNGIFTDDTFFAYIATLDEGDDWTDPVNWIKANPNLGVSVYLDDLKRQCDKAMRTPSAAANFLCKRLNVWVNQSKQAIDLQKWKKNNKPLPDLTGRVCYGGWDLSRTTDLTSVVLVFLLENGDFAIIHHSFIPEDTALEHERTDKVPYKTWEKLGYVTLTPGNVVDYDFIEQWFIEKAKEYDIKEIDYDPYNATQLATKMANNGFNMVEIIQNYTNLSEPTKEMERLYMDYRLIHGNDPVLTWAASNVVFKTGPSGNIMMDKAKSVQRIDPMAAFINALGGALRDEDNSPVYETGSEIFSV